MSLRTILSNYGFAFHRELFPALEEELGPLGERYELFVTVLGFVQVEQFLTCLRGLPGRPQEDRAALARAFIAKAVFAITKVAIHPEPTHPASDALGRSLQSQHLTVPKASRRLERQLRIPCRRCSTICHAPLMFKRGAKGYQAVAYRRGRWRHSAQLHPVAVTGIGT